MNTSATTCNHISLVTQILLEVCHWMFEYSYDNDNEQLALQQHVFYILLNTRKEQTQLSII